MNTKKRAWLYLRSAQRKEKIEGHARHMGFDIVGISEDLKSCLNFDRTGLHEVLDAAEAKKMDIVVVYSISEIGRDMVKTIDYIQKLNNYEISLYSLLGGEITAEKLEKDDLLSLFNETEKKEISNRSLQNLKDLKEQLNQMINYAIEEELEFDSGEDFLEKENMLVYDSSRLDDATVQYLKNRGVNICRLDHPNEQPIKDQGIKICYLRKT